MSVLLQNQNSLRGTIPRNRRIRKPLQNTPKPLEELKDIYVVQQKISGDTIFRTGIILTQPKCCEECSGEVSRSHSSQQKYVDIPENGKITELSISVDTFKCRRCEKQKAHLPDSLISKRRLTKRAIQYILSTHGKTLTNVSMAKELGISEKTVRNVKKENGNYL